jgi:hypothetical protein
MFPGNPNPFLQPPGKLIEDIQRKQMPSGQVVERQQVEVTSFENNMLHKKKLFETIPRLADGTSPELADIRECHVCLGLYHKDNVSHCPSCGRDYCGSQECRGEIEVSKEERTPVCRPCADEINMSALKRTARRFWEI